MAARARPDRARSAAITAAAVLLAGCAGRTQPEALTRAFPAPAATLTLPIPPLAEPTAVEVWPVAYTGNAERGTIGPIRFRVRPASDCVPVAIGEQYPTGSGQGMRASVWLAATTAARMVGRSVNDYCIRADVRGHVDGPSAGALFTAALMAAMTGTPVKADVTMSGTIDPDGNVGRVGGLGGKLGAAIHARKRVFGYPRGQRSDKDPASGREQDLVRIAAGRITLRELETALDAFHLLTGRQLVYPAPLGEDAMRLPAASRERARAQIGPMLLRGSRALASAARLAQRQGLPGLPALLRSLDERLKLAATQLRGDRVSSALLYSVDAATTAMALTAVLEDLGRQPASAPLAQRLRRTLASYPNPRRRVRPVMSVGGVSAMTCLVAEIRARGNARFRASALLARLVRPAASGRAPSDPAEPAPDLVLARALQDTLMVYAAESRIEIMRPFWFSGPDLGLVHPSLLERTARAIAVESEARLAYASLFSSRGEIVPLSSLRSAESYVDQNNVAWPHYELLAASRASLLSSYALLMARLSGEVIRRRQTALFTERLARTLGRLAREQVGGVPMMAAFHYEVAAERLEARDYLAAQTHFDAAATECRIALLLRSR